MAQQSSVFDVVCRVESCSGIWTPTKHGKTCLREVKVMEFGLCVSVL